jgi:hypothetical protein
MGTSFLWLQASLSASLALPLLLHKPYKAITHYDWSPFILSEVSGLQHVGMHTTLLKMASSPNGLISKQKQPKWNYKKNTPLIIVRLLL